VGDTRPAMSQENVETITRLYDEFLARPERVIDTEILQFFDPAVELRQSESFLGTVGTFHGYDGLVRSALELFETFRDLHWVPIKIIDAGDQVVATFEARAIGKHSDVEVKVTGGHVWTLRDGRVVTWDVYMEPSQAFEAVGLSE
jgi:ketosteroid isomerase-like protein